MIGGYATAEGTERYRDRWSDSLADDHFELSGDLHTASIGIGTYLGEPNSKDDRAYQQAVRQVIEQGCNVIDTAINYRYQRSERNIGRALEDLFRGDNDHERDEIIVSTKGGYVPFDGEPPENPRDYVMETYVDSGIAEVEELVDGSHCISPDYLEHELQVSRDNLGLETIDRYYVHNPETQLSALDEESFYNRLEAAFQRLEQAVERNQIRHYGLATWNGFRVPPDHDEYLDLEEIVEKARKAGGTDHHLKAIQLPYNLAMAEGLTRPNQTIDDKSVSLLEAAYQHDLTVTTSATLMQGSLTDQFPDDLRNKMTQFDTDAQRAIQFARCAPGVTTALVGMKSPDHIEENLAVAEHDRIDNSDYMERFFVRE